MIGHYKTYTIDAPLMGKHVGKYWWGGEDPNKRRDDNQMTFDELENDDTSTRSI